MVEVKETKEDKDIKLTLVTSEILERINIMREDIKKSMMVGEGNILRGITIFEEVVKEMNPVDINDDIFFEIEKNVNLVISSREEKYQKVNQHVHFGIDRCYMMLYMYNKMVNRNKKKVLK